MAFLGNLQPDNLGWTRNQVEGKGRPEIWLFVGRIYGRYNETGSVDLVNSNKLLLLTVNNSGELIVQKDFGQIIPENYDGTGGTNRATTGGLTWITRNIFILGVQSDCYEAGSDDDLENTVAHYTMKAFKLTETDPDDPTTWTITEDPVWTRRLLKEGYSGNGNNPCGGGTGWENKYPGFVSGHTYLPPGCKTQYNFAKDENELQKHILLLTGKRPYRSTAHNQHEVSIMRLDSLPSGTGTESIANEEYYADSDAWDPGSLENDSLPSSFKVIRTWGTPDYWQWQSSCTPASRLTSEDTIDHQEGWCSVDSRGNFYYGTSDWIGGGRENGCNSYGCPGGGAQNPPTKFWNENYDYDCVESYANVVFLCSTFKVNVDSDTGGLNADSTRQIMIFDRPNKMIDGVTDWPYDWTGDPDGTTPHPPQYNINNQFGNSGGDGVGLGLNDAGLPFDARQDGSINVGFLDNADQSHNIKIDAGCFDVYGETSSILNCTQEQAKDTLWLWMAPNNQSAGQPESCKMRGGLWAFKEKSNSASNQVLEAYAHFPFNNSSWNGVGLAYDADHYDSDSGSKKKPQRFVLSSGMSFRPNSYK